MLRRLNPAVAFALAFLVVASPAAFAQESRWATEDGVVGVALPEGWTSIRSREPSTVLFLVSNEMRSNTTAFGACSISRDVVPVLGRTQGEANQIALEWATDQMSDYADTSFDQAMVGEVSVVSFTGVIQQGQTRFREFVRFLQVGAAEQSVSYMLSCRVGLASPASDEAARQFAQSLTVNGETP